MTDEQIKQNAEEYADKNCVFDYNSVENYAVMNAFIAGAHSRDEEIKELQNELESLRKGFYERGDKLKELMLANNKLRNPWISVEERLPDYPESEYDIDNMYLVCREGGSFVFNAIFRRNGKWYICDNMQTTEIIAPDYWMPMPQIKKGE